MQDIDKRDMTDTGHYVDLVCISIAAYNTGGLQQIRLARHKVMYDRFVEEAKSLEFLSIRNNLTESMHCTAGATKHTNNHNTCE